MYIACYIVIYIIQLYFILFIFTTLLFYSKLIGIILYNYFMKRINLNNELYYLVLNKGTHYKYSSFGKASVSYLYWI